MPKTKIGKWSVGLLLLFSLFVLAGLLMILMGFSIAGVRGPVAWIEKHNYSVLRTARRFTGSPSALRFYPLGLLLGLLPCGLSYTVFIASA